jgi:hypothetical protein
MRDNALRQRACQCLRADPAATRADEETFLTAGHERKAMHYVVKVHVPSVAGAISSLLGKTPPDSHVWILGAIHRCS